MKIEELLKLGIKELNNIDEASLKVKMLLANILGESKEYLIIHKNREISGNVEAGFLKYIERLKQGEPIQYIIGKTEFYGLEFTVNPSVLIPQPDTEILVEEVIDIYNKNYRIKNTKISILDLCTGSGAIAISLKKNLNNVEVFASDISKKALEVAKKNAIQNKTEINFIESNLFEKIEEKFDIIVSNPPYIESDVLKTLSEEVKHEPVLALDGGEDGLDFYKKIAKEAKDYLKENGILALEIGFNQKESVIKLLEQEGYSSIYSKKDYGGNDRIVVGKI